MNVNRILAYELKGGRISIWRVEDGSFVVCNTFTNKALLCLSIEQALDVFDYCIVALKGNAFIN